jgi:hypothetical protein
MHSLNCAFEVFLDTQRKMKCHCVIGAGLVLVGLRGRQKTKVRPKLEKTRTIVSASVIIRKIWITHFGFTQNVNRVI